MSNQKFKNIYTQPKRANQQAQMRRNTLGVLIEQSKVQTYTTSQRQANEQAKSKTNALGVLIEPPKSNKHAQRAKGWSKSWKR